MSETNRKNALEIISQQAEAYKDASRSDKGKIIDSLASVLHRNRKSIIRTLNMLIRRQTKRGPIPHYKKYKYKTTKKRRGRPRIYTKEVEAALSEIWGIYNCICAERLHGQIASGVEILKRDGDWHYSNQTTTLLLQMPLGTMKSYLVKMARDRGLMHGVSSTRSSELLDLVPIFRGDWSNMPLGYGQIDTVVHSGPRLEGAMVYTANFIEMQTYWQEFRAQLGKTAEVTRDTISQLFRRTPFKIAGIHSDSGDEFINHALVAWCHQRHIDFTRSRPYEKNDNANVEERNRSIVRHYIGFERYDCTEAVDAMNMLYDTLRLYVNFFQPIMKVKTKVYTANGKCYRKYEPAQTPYERVLAHPDILEEAKRSLRAQYATLNPKQLLAKIKALTIKLEQIQRAAGYHF